MELSDLKARIGKVLKGKWTLERLIGAGGMAAVYAAKHEIGRDEAIKILHAEVAKDDELVARFKREAHAVNRFKHPAAVEIRDVDVSEDGEPFLVMELLEGISVSRKVKRDGPLEQDEIMRVADELLDVLVAAHGEGVIHRDIKPANLFFEKDGRLRVLDFGMARVEAPPGGLVTEVGTQLGTVAYMPPEQLRGAELDHRADIYAVGATLFRLLSGERTHDADGEDELARKILSQPARPLGKVSSKVDEHICLIVDRALSRDPDERYPDAATMQDDVRAVREGDEPPFASSKLSDGELRVSDTIVEDDDVTVPKKAKPKRAKPTNAASKKAASKTARAKKSDADDKDAAQPEAGHTEAGQTEIGQPIAGAAAIAPTLIDDEEATKKMEPDVDDEATTRVKKPTPMPPPHEADEGGSSMLLWIAIVGAVGFVAWLSLRGGDETVDETIPVDAPTTVTASAEPAAETAAGQGGRGELVPGKPGTSTATASAGPPGRRPPFKIPSALPSSIPLPSSWPTAIPTSLPTSFPTSLPTSIPSAFPSNLIPPPRPSAPPPPPPPPAP